MKDNSTGKTKGFYERGQAVFDRIPKMPEKNVKVALNPQLPWPFPSAAPKKKPEQLPAAPF